MKNKKEKESEKTDDSININYKTNRSFIPFQYKKEKTKEKEKEKGRNKEEIFDKEIIYYSKTESNHDFNKKKKFNNIINTHMNKDKNKSDYFYASHKMKISHFREEKKIQNLEQKNVMKNIKFSDLNKYMNNAHNINIYSNRIKNETKPKNISLNNYFELNKINKTKKSVNNIYNDINIYHKSFLEGKYGTNNNNKNKIYSETERFIIKHDINKDKSIDVINKEKKLLKLENILEELKINQKEIKDELTSLTKHNSELEENTNIKNNNIYNNIKNILDDIENNNKNNITKIDSNYYKSLSYQEKCKYLRKKYLEEKLQKSLIEKINSLYNNTYNTINDGDINSGNYYDLNNLLNWVISLVENIDYLKMQNDKLKLELNEKIKETDNYKMHYNNWANIFSANSKEEIIQNINELIKEQNYNNNEKIKMIKMLFNKQHS